MKKYLFGFGAMLVGAGLMFVFTHTEVSAEDKLKIKEMDCEIYQGGLSLFSYCKIKDLTCVSGDNGISCVRGSMF
jgi:hypothetical protein